MYSDQEVVALFVMALSFFQAVVSPLGMWSFIFSWLFTNSFFLAPKDLVIFQYLYKPRIMISWGKDFYDLITYNVRQYFHLFSLTAQALTSGLAVVLHWS